jgi:hypothetical protein
MQIISRLSKKLLASQERLSSMELLGWPVIWLVGWLAGWLVGWSARSFASQSVSQRSRVGADLGCLTNRRMILEKCRRKTYQVTNPQQVLAYPYIKILTAISEQILLLMLVPDT